MKARDWKGPHYGGNLSDHQAQATRARPVEPGHGERVAIRRLAQTVEDEMVGRVVYDLGDGRYANLRVDDIQRHGVTETLRAMGVNVDGVDQITTPVPVFQHGRHVGSVPYDFEPFAIRSRNPLYDPRSGDFRRTAEGWIASNTLGPGDLEAIPGFVWSHP